MQSDAALAIAGFSPISYWDGSVGGTLQQTDVIGGFDAYPINAPNPHQVGADGVTTSAFDCDGQHGQNYYETLGDPFSGSLIDTFTVGAWVYATANPDGSGVICDPYGFNSAAGILMGAGVDTFAGDFLGGGHDVSGFRFVIQDFSSTPLNTWVFVVLTFDAFSSDGFNLFIDGALANTSSGSYSNTGYNIEKIQLGYLDGSFGTIPAWPGLIDQPFLLNYALQQVDVQTIFDAMALPAGGSGLSVSPLGVASGFSAPGAALELNVSAAGAVASGEAVGTQGLELNVSPSAVASGEAVGTSVLELNVSPAGTASGEAIGAHTLAGGTPPPVIPRQLPTLGAG